MTPAMVALRDAIRAHLAADEAVRALVADRIHDRVPGKRDGLAFPFLAFGPMRLERLETGGDDPSRPAKVRLYTASRDYERDQAWAVAEAAGEALDGLFLTIAGPWEVATELRVAMIGDAIETNLPRDVFLDVACTLIRA